MPAPPLELLAYLWPAIALGPFEGGMTIQAAGPEPSPLLRVLPVVAMSALLPDRAPASAGPSRAAPDAPEASPDPGPFLSPHGEGMSFLVTVITVLAAIVGVVALARLTVGEDLFSTRWLH